MLLSTIILLFGFILLIWSADEFTNNGAKVAKLLHISPLLIGILIFGFGTSAPEILVSSLAAFEQNSNLSIGNALGSNIINISLVLGISAVIAPISVASGIFKKEWLILMLATLLATMLLQDNYLSLIDGFILIISLLITLIFIAKGSKNTQLNDLIETNSPIRPIMVWSRLILSLMILIAAAQMVVWGGSAIAVEFGVSQAIIGLTLVAFGTSLPELSIAITSAIKKQHDMVIGNIIGSNLFNTLAVMAMPGIIYPSAVDKAFISRDMPIIFVLTIGLFLVAYRHNKPHYIQRWGGFILIGVGGFYLTQLF